MRWLGAGVGVVGIALALVGCTSTTDETLPTTSLTINATEAVVQNDAIIRYGLSATPTESWAHYRTSCDTACAVVVGAITETLFATSVDGETVGLLVENFRSNNDYTIHTWELRSDIVFADGTPLDAEAAKINIDACRHSLLTGPGLAGIDDVRAEGQTLTITTLAPWGNLAVHFAETPCGHVYSGAWLRSLADLPMRTEGAPFFDPQIASLSPVGDPTVPVGLGAFVMTSFAPGNGNSTLLERNPTYWRGPAGITGESLPRAERIELVVIGDDATRRAGLEAGQFDVIHTDAPEERLAVEALGSFVSSDAFAGVTHVAMNAQPSDANPLSLVSCRRAIDRSIDRLSLGEMWNEQPRGGPFFDLPAGVDDESVAQDEIEGASFSALAAEQWGARCIEDHGADVVLRLAATVGDGRAATVAAMVERSIGVLPDGGGVSIEIIEVTASDLAIAALLGDFDLLLWDGFSGVHPDLHFSWWFSDAAQPVGSLATNVSRINDPALDRALVDLRRADSVERTDRAVAEAQRAFDAGVWTSWLTSTSWTIGFGEELKVDLSRSTPEGIELVPIIDGAHSLAGLDED